MERRDIYVTMVLLTIFIVLSVASGDQAITMKADPVNGLMERQLSKK